jgi:tricorn protease
LNFGKNFLYTGKSIVCLQRLLVEQKGYFRYPSVWKDQVSFIWNQSVWLTDVHGGKPQRISVQDPDLCDALLGQAGVAFLSKGKIYFAPTHEAKEKLVSGVCENTRLIGWYDDSCAQVVVSSSHQHPFTVSALYTVCLQTGQVNKLPLGSRGTFACWDSDHKTCVIQRDGYGYGSWQKYKGGMAGHLWIDREGTGDFQPLDLGPFNQVCPYIFQDRIYFLSDKRGFGQLFSCDFLGNDRQCHTQHQEFYPMNLRGSGHQLVYTTGGNIHLFDLLQKTDKILAVPVLMQNTQEARQTYCASKFLSEYDLSAKGDWLSVVSRGRLFFLSPSKGPVYQKGQRDGVRYRLPCFIDHQRCAVVADNGLHDALHIYSLKEGCQPVSEYDEKNFKDLDKGWGYLTSLRAHSKKKEILLATNHRHELLKIDLSTQTLTIMDISECGPVAGYDWSGCGRFVAYGLADNSHAGRILIYDLETEEKHVVAGQNFVNQSPTFSVCGKYLYFLSSRDFKADYGPLHFDLHFDPAVRPFVLTLQKDIPTPFLKPFEKYLSQDSSQDLSEDLPQENQDSSLETKSESEKNQNVPVPQSDAQPSDTKHAKATVIDFQDIEARLQAFPLEPRDYQGIWALEDSVMYTVEEEKGRQALYSYSFEKMQEELILPKINPKSLTFSEDRKLMAYCTDRKLRVVKAGVKPDDQPDPSFHQGGWVDLSRIVLNVCPAKEWPQMFAQAWRLQRDLFWKELPKEEWDGVYTRYAPLISLLSTPQELRSLIWEMHGELGTSHAYVYTDPSRITRASLGAELSYCSQHQGYEVKKIWKGDDWHPHPLKRPDLNVQEGAFIWALGGQPLSLENSPEILLKSQEGRAIPMTFSQGPDEAQKTVLVFPRTVAEERKWRYRQWVNQNTQYVHQKSEGRLGYVHIPDMGTFGLECFMRTYLQEFDRDGLIIDVRFNGGGNVSSVIFRYLTQKRVGYDKTRWHGVVEYPLQAPQGPMVALINGHTGSDGDVFAHTFRHLGLGSLIGKRTWGGVVGIMPRYDLVDGSYTSQPEFSFWFDEVGWGLENHGAEPDISVDITPADYEKGIDPQLDCAITEGLIRVQENEVRKQKLYPALL